MGAIGLNPIRLDRIGLDPIRINAIKLGVPRAASDRPYIDPEVLASLKAVCICYGKSNDDPDRAIVKNLVDPDNPFVISNAAYTEGSGYADKDSPYYGAFVTDGIDDMITSTKTLAEMGITDEVTVVSMIHQISLNPTYNNGFTNYIENLDKSTYVRNNIYKTGNTGIYGYSASLTSRTYSDINNILGDKKDYGTEIVNRQNTLDRTKFSVVGRASNISEVSSIAWYWNFISNKYLTTDQINQVIAYFNLDRTLKPDILCNTIKQGITNENHAEFGDKLIDFSGNGRDIQLNNLAWDGDSGIGKYNYPNWKVTATIANTYSTIVNYPTVNGTYSINVNGVSELMQSIGLHLEIKYTTSTGIIYNDIKQDGVYSYILPDGATDLTLRFGGIPGIVNEPCNITITQIPSHAGALYLDGVSDFGQFVGDLGLKDYTFIADRAYDRIVLEQAPFIASKSTNGQAPFLMEYLNSDNYVYPHSFGATTKTTNLNIQRQISYQSTYVYNGNSISKGTSVDTGDGLTIGNSGSTGAQYSPLCLWSLMLFPYSMSEFLIERQLKKHKLGTLYPDMVEFRPVIKTNVDYTLIQFYINNYTKRIYPGDYIPINTPIEVNFYLKNNVDELISFKVNGNDSTFKRSTVVDTAYNIRTLPITKSPQKIDITIDEYIRYEDIVQPYPVLLRFKDENGNEVSWGGKFKVGSTITRIGSAADSNLLPNIYNIFGLLLNDNQVTSSKVIVEKTMVFKAKSAYIFDNNEPKCILSPRLLRIPNSSYKILGHIPDISGHGNHGVIHNSAYAEGSGVNEDGSYQFDGVDDFVTIPTVTGGKQVLMKINNNTINSMLYDQRSSGASPNSLYSDFAIYCTNSADNNQIAYQSRLVGNTYIDGILNTNITCEDLLGVLHNITITCDIVAPNNGVVPNIGRGGTFKDLYSNMALYDFMLFDNISTDDKIKELNEYVGIEAKVELPPYYWDAYGKTNLDEDRSTIQQRGVAIGDYDLINNNFAYEGMSGYNGYPAVFGTNKTYANLVPNDGNFILTSSHNIINVTKFDTSHGLLYSHIKLDGKLTSRNIDYPSYKIKVTGLGENFGLHYSYLESSSDTTVKGFEINNDGIYIIPKSFASDGSLTSNSDWIGFIFTGTAPESCNVTIEVLPEYENGLVYDGITDYSENINIPAFTDYTYIFKRDILGFNSRSTSMHKGTSTNHGRAFTSDYDYGETNEVLAYSFGSSIATPNATSKKIIYGTKASVDGQPITPGTNVDDVGLFIGKWYDEFFKKMVFYKLILYPKTIPLLQINFLKNLMQRDEIIDLTNPIFIQE